MAVGVCVDEVTARGGAGGGGLGRAERENNVWVGLLQQPRQFAAGDDTELWLATVKIAPQCWWRAVVSEQKEQWRKNAQICCAAAQLTNDTN